MRSASRCLVGLAAVVGWLVPASALAFEDGLVTVGGGVLGWTGANFLDKPSDQTIPVNGQNVSPDGIPEYPGFAGTSLGFGFFTEVRFFKYVGLELECIPTRDRGTADLKVTYYSASGGADSHQFKAHVAQDAWHVPLLLKGVLPGELVSGNLFLGPEFVIPSDIVKSGPMASTEGDNPGTIQYSATAGSYTMFTFGLGLEINLPIPGVDIRLPIAVRGGYNPGVPDKRSEMANHTPVNQIPTQIEFKSEWKWEAAGTFGAGVHF
jgi:hypothetical protein